MRNLISHIGMLWVILKMKKKIQILILITISFTSYLLGQSEYKKYIVANSSKKTHFIKTKSGDSRITYLGTVRNRKGDTLYYVLSDFSRVKAAIQMHGHSNIIFLNNKKEEIKKFDVGLPENLPFKLLNNVLYFKHINDKTKKEKLYKFEISATLPKLICVDTNDCY